MNKLIGPLFAAALFTVPAAARAQATVGPTVAHPVTTTEERRERREERRERKGRGEAHPAIRGAIRSLERAKDELQHASHDFGGHRVDALKSIDESLRQLRLALEFDKK